MHVQFSVTTVDDALLFRLRMTNGCSPLLTQTEAQDVVEVLGVVLDGGDADEQLMFCLLSYLAVRVQSRGWGAPAATPGRCCVTCG
ncbi:hypothetical protein ACFWZ2_40005 [Streptomyces sp. NPDC059002]|uniref:hypothetical protein n=1 Tax=Streptomyces sp. NPDC059002 TaxID=3346690 RepID=UPI00367693C5